VISDQWPVASQDKTDHRSQITDHIQYMRHALRLAERGLGNVYPNPAVGAVIVKDNVIIGRGWTARGGRPHAETIALAQAGDAAHGAALYVNLEPCAHQGKTPPCTQSIAKAGIKRVVAACTDPNPLVSGKGFEQLRANGIEVIEKVCETDAIKLNEGFFSAIKRKRPFVTLKLATSLDGKIAKENGESKWITCEASRKTVHLLRATHDAILTGIGTVLADNPNLTCRLPGREADSPERIIIDSQLRTPADARILPAWIFTSETALQTVERRSVTATTSEQGRAQPARHQDAKRLSANINLNAKIFTAAYEGDYLSLPHILETLASEGITRLLVEAGSLMAGSFMRQNLVDRIYWFRSPAAIGENGLDALHKQEISARLAHYSLRETAVSGVDALEIYDRSDI